MTTPQLFLDLEGFAHRALWEPSQPVWSALGVIESYLQTIPHRIEIPIPEGVFLQNPERISIGRGTLLEPGALIRGPCILGRNVQVRQGAFVREGTICGDGCIIGHSCEVKHSILLDGAVLSHFVYLGDGILGRGVNLGAGVKCANLRLDRSFVSVWVEGQKRLTSFKKLSGVVGDGSQIGCNSVLNPGTLIGKQAKLGALLNIQGWIPAGFRAVSQEQLLERLM